MKIVEADRAARAKGRKEREEECEGRREGCRGLCWMRFCTSILLFGNMSTAPQNSEFTWHASGDESMWEHSFLSTLVSRVHGGARRWPSLRSLLHPLYIPPQRGLCLQAATDPNIPSFPRHHRGGDWLGRDSPWHVRSRAKPNVHLWKIPRVFFLLSKS